jgi:DNA polymerase-3 subunit alpha
MEHLVAVRQAGGPFRDLFDFMERVDPRLVNRRCLEALARAGALDSIHPDRAQIVASSEALTAHAQSLAQERASSQVSLFGGEQADAARPRLDRGDPWNALRKLDEELAAVGFYLTGHPLQDLTDLLRRRRSTFIIDVITQAEAGAEAFRMAGVVRRRQERAQASGERFAFVSLSDPTGEYEVLFPPEALRKCRDILEPGQAIALKVRAKARDGEVRLFGDDAEPLEKTLENVGAGLRVHLAARGAEMTAIRKRLDAALVIGSRGGDVIIIAPVAGSREVEMKLPGRYALDAALRGALKVAPGVAFLEDV